MVHNVVLAPAGHLEPSVKRNQLLHQHFFTSGRHYWEVFVSRMSRHAAVVVGIAASECFECETLSDARVSWTTDAIGYAASGAIAKDGIVVARVESFAQGDTVGVLLDMNVRTITFFRNGVQQRLCECDSRSSIDPITTHFVDKRTRNDEDIELATRAGADCASDQASHCGCTLPRVLAVDHRTVFAALAFDSSCDSLAVHMHCVSPTQTHAQAC